MVWKGRPDNSKFKVRAIRLRQEKDLSYNQIAKKLGFTEKTIRRWVDPAYAEKSRKYLKKYIARRYHEDPQFRQNMIDSICTYGARRRATCKTYLESHRSYCRNYYWTHKSYFKKYYKNNPDKFAREPLKVRTE